MERDKMHMLEGCVILDLAWCMCEGVNNTIFVSLYLDASLVVEGLEVYLTTWIHKLLE
jgi:hypothetical protein